MVQTLEEAQRFLIRRTNQTNYERVHNIHPVEARLIWSDEDIKFQIETTDGKKGLNILFRIGQNVDNWFIWRILNEQAKALIQVFPDLFKQTIDYNEKVAEDGRLFKK